MRGFFDTGREDIKIPPLLVCFSPLRWHDDRQRLQKLMTRAAADRQIVFMEEPVYADDEPVARLEITHFDDGIAVAVPYMPSQTTHEGSIRVRRQMLDTLLARAADRTVMLWYTDPAALEFTRHLDPDLIIYDCKGDPALDENGLDLLSRADVVFTDAIQGGLQATDAQIDEIWRSQKQQIDQRLTASALAFTEDDMKRRDSAVPSPGSDAAA